MSKLEQALLQLVGESYAVLTDEQIKDMAVSMDISTGSLVAMFESFEKKWEEIKDDLARSE